VGLVIINNDAAVAVAVAVAIAAAVEDEEETAQVLGFRLYQFY
jgi:hypothetical protein